MWASASFVGVLIVIGLPLWWKTTEVYRVSLPYDKIISFNTLPSVISTRLTVLANDEATADEIVGVIEKAFESSDIIKLNITKQIVQKSLRCSLESIADEQEALEEVASTFDAGNHNSFYIVQRTPLFQDVWLGGERILFYRSSNASSTIVKTLEQWVYQTSVLEGAASETPDAARRVRFPPGAGYHVVLSVVHPAPEKMKVRFNVASAVEDYVGLFVDELRVLHNFTLKSQWLHLLDFDFHDREVKDGTEWGRHYAVEQDRLHLLLTKLEERTATHVSELPTINFALYAAPCLKAPLIIYELEPKVNEEKQAPIKSRSSSTISKPVQAFMSPKWGGVMLGNPSREECGAENPTYQPNVRLVMGTFISQLRKLLGITDNEQIEGAHLEPLRSVPPRKWEIDNLLRIRTLEQLTSAQRTLQSLAQLLGEISNIVINDEVGASINSAVDSIQRASELLSTGYLVEAYKMSQSAFLAAETAFMEPSLLALLYFPDDQKYAIYIPLFLPVMFPVLLSLKNLILWLRGKPIHKQKLD